jgi:pyruvate dehydrogenase E2 component (dihydrolipoamide acetyltransferase)
VVEADVIRFSKELIEAKKLGKATPLAQKVAADKGIDLAVLTGSGFGGKVTTDDVLKAASPVAASAAQAQSLESSDHHDILKTIPISGMRKIIAENVARSASTAPHVTLTIPVDMTEAAKLRAILLPSVEKAHGVRVSYTDIIVKALAKALIEQPVLNSTIAPDKITQYKAVHISIAVSLGENGLVTPTLRNAHLKSISEISVEIKALAAKARSGKLTIDEMTGGTFTISNIGNYGVEHFTPIINPPQTGILGVCAIKDQIVPLGGAPAVRPIMNLCLSFDHRVTDGAPAASFLSRMKELLEQPYLILA